MKIGEVVKSKRTGGLYKVVEGYKEEIKGYICEPVKCAGASKILWAKTGKDT